MFESIRNIYQKTRETAKVYFEIAYSKTWNPTARLLEHGATAKHQYERALPAGPYLRPILEWSPAFLMANKKKLAPVLLLATEGNKELQKWYSQFRVTQLDTLPEWVQDNCFNEARSAFYRYPIYSYIRRGVKGPKVRDPSDDFTRQDLSRIMLPALSTLKDAHELLRLAKKHHFHGKVDARPTGGVTLRFHVLENGPEGNCARKCLAVAVRYIETSIILMDLLDAIGAKLNRDELIKIVQRNLNDPWKIRQDKTVSRIFLAYELLREQGGIYSPSELNSIFDECLVRHPKLFIHHHLNSESLSSKDQEEDFVLPVNSADVDSVCKIPLETTSRNLLIDAILDEITSNSISESRGDARALYKFVKLGIVSYPELVDLIETKKTLQDITDVCEQKSEETQAQSQFEATVLPNLPEPIDSTKQPKIDKQVELIFKEEFVKWRDSLSEAGTKKRIQRRLARVKTGNFGWHSWVRGNLLELKEDIFRVYLRRVSDSPKGYHRYEVLLGGNKNTQDQDIAFCEGIGE